VLLRAEAHLVTRAEEVVELIGRSGELASDEPRPASPLDDLSEPEKRVYDALPARGARTLDQIAVASGMPPTQVLAPLSTLEISGLVSRQDGRWKLARSR
jgi:DNA processing protein